MGGRDSGAVWVGLTESRAPGGGSLSPRVYLLSAFTCPPGPGVGGSSDPCSQPSVPRAAFTWLSIHGARKPQKLVPAAAAGGQGRGPPGLSGRVCRRDCARVLADTPHTLVAPSGGLSSVGLAPIHGVAATDTANMERLGVVGGEMNKEF